jgi:hypothetical protein
VKKDFPDWWLPDAARDAGGVAERVGDAESQEIRRRATAAFGDGSGVVTTESFADATHITGEGNWRLIEDFGYSGPVYVFTNPLDGDSVFRFLNIGDALRALAEAPQFDFYLVDRECTFMFAENSYETLFGCGLARDFVGRLSVRAPRKN